MGCIANTLTKFQASDNELIPGLPYDLVFECLLRVPITSHPSLRFVSHLWNSTISTPSFFSFRRYSHTAEHLIFLIQPRCPPPLTDPTILVAETACLSDDNNKNKPAGAGGGDGSNRGGSPPLLYNLNMYNMSSQKWGQLFGISTIPTFAQLVVLPNLGKLVVLGGWDPSTLEDDNKFWVVSGYGTESQGRFRPTGAKSATYDIMDSCRITDKYYNLYRDCKALLTPQLKIEWTPKMNTMHQGG